MLNICNWLDSLVECFTLYGGGKGGGGGTTSSNTIQNADPWKGVQPYLVDLLKSGQQTTRQPYQFYSGDTVSPFSPEQQFGFNLTTQRALAGSPTLNAANNSVTNTLNDNSYTAGYGAKPTFSRTTQDTINGTYLNPDTNPYLKKTVNQALNDVTGRVNSQFSNANFGGSANQELLARNLGDTANSIYGQNYATERAYQNQAANQQDQMSLQDTFNQRQMALARNQLQAAAVNQAPGLASADYLDPSQLQGVGAQRQNLANQYLGQAQNTFQGAADWPYTQLQRYGNIVSQGTGQGGTTSSTTTGPNPNQSNPFANAFGLASTGLGLYNGLAGGGLLSGLGAGAAFNPGISFPVISSAASSAGLFGGLGGLGGAALF